MPVVCAITPKLHQIHVINYTGHSCVQLQLAHSYAFEYQLFPNCTFNNICARGDYNCTTVLASQKWLYALVHTFLQAFKIPKHPPVCPQAIFKKTEYPWVILTSPQAILKAVNSLRDYCCVQGHSFAWGHVWLYRQWNKFSSNFRIIIIIE